MLCCSRPGLSGHSHSRSPRKQRFQLQLMELEGVTLSNGVLFAKVRLLGGGRFCAYSSRKEIRDNKVAWTDHGPMEFACRLGGPGPPTALRVSVRKEERGGRSYSKLGYAVLNLTELLGSSELCSTAEHSCILSPYSQRQRLDNSTLRLGVRRMASNPTAVNHPASAAAVPPATVAAPSPGSGAVKPLETTDIASASLSGVVCHIDQLTGHPPIVVDSSTSVSAAAAAAAAAAAVHCRNPSSFSFASSVLAHSRTNSLDQDTLVPAANSSQSSSVPSFDLHLPSSLERKRAALTSARELSSRIANTRTDNFKIVREVLEQEGIRIVGPVADHQHSARLVNNSFT